MATNPEIRDRLRAEINDMTEATSYAELAKLPCLDKSVE